VDGDVVGRGPVRAAVVDGVDAGVAVPNVLCDTGHEAVVARPADEVAERGRPSGVEDVVAVAQVGLPAHRGGMTRHEVVTAEAEPVVAVVEQDLERGPEVGARDDGGVTGRRCAVRTIAVPPTDAARPLSTPNVPSPHAQGSAAIVRRAS
jgi:hypothetical protein